MSMKTLFDHADNGRSRPGFRLHTLELYNWGTFHDQVWRIQPCGQMALLTGENGSGKSTLVDALLTLLVPNRKRNYNQAGGTGKRERSEYTYVRGAYGKLQGEDGYSAQVQYLRGKESYSVLLAHFANDAAGQTVTLAQVFWLQDGVKKFHVVATRPLTIADHFSQFASIRALKKQLRETADVTVEDQFNRYSRRFRKLLGLRSRKTLDLFNQTVTIKEIGQLNEFVRNHMLEKTEAQEKIAQLQEHYQNLMLAYRAMQKAEHQLSLLEPLAAEARKYEAAQAEIETLRACQDAIPVYFAGKKWQLLQTAVSAAKADLAQAQHQLKQTEARLTELREQDTALSIAINNDETGRRLRELEQDLRYARQTQQRKKDDADRYNELAQTLDLPPCQDEAGFYQTREQAQKMEKQLAQQAEQAAEQLRQAQIRENELRQTRRNAQQELDSLRGRTSQIPNQNLRLRARILDALAIAEADVPFVGELLQVKASEREWEGAIERLLHNFGLRLLVPERHYERFRRHVNQTNLKGRIVFHRVPDAELPRRHMPDDPHALLHKLEIKPDSVYYDLDLLKQRALPRQPPVSGQ